MFGDIELAKKTFAKPAYLIDLTQMSDEKIKKHNLIGLLEFCQKHVRDLKFLQQATEDLAYIINKLDQYVNQEQYKGIEQGIEKGIEQGIEKVAKSMLAEGSDVNFISKVTKMTIEEINDLKAQMLKS